MFKNMWEDIPTDVLLSIFQRLDHLDDIFAVGAVCKSWKSTNDLLGKIQMPPNIPWLMLAEENKRGLDQEKDEINNNNIARGFYNLSDKKTYYINLPQASGRRCWSIGFGWLFTIGVDLQINLLHAFSKCQINLPPQSSFVRQAHPDYEPHEIRDLYITKVIASTNPWDPYTQESNEDCVIMTISGMVGMLAFARLKDKVWMDVEMVPRQYNDIAYYNSKFYALAKEDVYSCYMDIDGGPFALRAGSVPQWVGRYQRSYLVESSGELLLVYRRLDFKEDEFLYVTKSFGVLKLKMNDNGRHIHEFVKVNNLGDQAIFIGHNASFSFSASSVKGCKDNTIYFTDDTCPSMVDKNPTGLDMGTYNLENNIIERHYNGDSLSYFSSPLWYI